jgi:hypothetical protein
MNCVAAKEPTPFHSSTDLISCTCASVVFKVGQLALVK